MYTIQVAAPVMSPSAGQYGGPQAVSLASSTARAEIRFTTDGSEPTAYSPLYTAPFVMGSSVTLKAKAFRTGCDASATTAGAYEISDLTPPTISAQMDPPPNAAGWHKTNVTVTFTCSDSGFPAASCTAPILVSQSGRGIEVHGEAIDAAGNRASLTVVLNVDRSAPRLTFYAPEEGGFLAPDTTMAAVRGNVLESLSGVESLSCGAQAGAISGQSFVCDVPVVAGSNSVLVTALDVAGNTAAGTITFSVSDPPAPTSLEITPEKMTMVSGETREIRVIDHRGRVVTGGTWTVDQPLVAQVGVEANAARVTALGSGQATLTLTRDGLSAEAIVTVLAAGTVAPEGTVLWESAPLGEPSVKRGQVLRATRADDGDAPSADIFFIDEGTQGVGDTIYRVNNRPTTIAATTFDGQRLWSTSFTRMGITDVAADARGGLTLVLRDISGSNDPWPQRVQRLDGATGVVSWAYVSDDGSLSEVAIHPDGTVFVTDHEYHTADTYLVALDGATGAATRWRLPYGDYQAYATGPVIRDDGSVVALVNPHDDGNHRHLQLATVAETTASPVFSDLYLASPDPYFDASEYRLIPQGDALLVAQKQDGSGVIRIGPDNTMGPMTTLLPAGMLFSAAEVDYAVSDTTGVALIKRESGHDGDPTNVYKATFDPVTLAAAVTPFSTDPYVSLRFISSDGDVYASGETGGMFGSNDNQVAFGVWAGIGARAVLSVAPILGAAPSSSLVTGGATSANAWFPGFSTIDEAAKDVLRNLNPISIFRNWEYAGHVCKTGAQDHCASYLHFRSRRTTAATATPIFRLARRPFPRSLLTTIRTLATERTTRVVRPTRAATS